MGMAGCDGLIGGHETAEAFLIHSSVAMGDDFKCDIIDAWQTGGWAIAQPRQFSAVAFGQVPLGHANLFFDQIEIIQQPFPGRCDASAPLHCLSHQIADFQQDGFTLGQSSEKLIRFMVRAHRVQSREDLAMLFHLLGAKQLRPQWGFIASILLCRAVSPDLVRQPAPAIKETCGGHFQIRGSLRSRSRRGLRAKAGTSRAAVAWGINKCGLRSRR
jgi:hypothetical protein